MSGKYLSQLEYDDDNLIMYHDLKCQNNDMRKRFKELIKEKEEIKLKMKEIRTTVINHNLSKEKDLSKLILLVSFFIYEMFFQYQINYLDERIRDATLLIVRRY